MKEESSIKKIIYKDKFNIKDRGDCYTFEFKDNDWIPDEIPGNKLSEYIAINNTVEIDGKRYEIKGIERWGTVNLHNAGILVKEVEEYVYPDYPYDAPKLDY